MKSSRTDEAVSIITLPQGSSQPNPPSLYSPRFMILKLQFKLGLPLNFSTRLIQVSMGPISGDLMLPMDVFLEYFSRLIPSSQYPGFFFSWLPPLPLLFALPFIFTSRLPTHITKRIKKWFSIRHIKTENLIAFVHIITRHKTIKERIEEENKGYLPGKG